ncbi:hypothetical protein MalM25_24690 [Planctomycetes bacterium MalM25]|nr:hypothetical protein MalM25_24690 [Planctomycetes bacterium MalM25]
MQRLPLVPITLLAAASFTNAQQPARPDLTAYEAGFARWEPAIAAFEGLDHATPDPEGAVLLVGSSSIRLWKSAAEDLKPYPVIQRGYGGAKFCDVAHFAPRIVTPHRFRATVVFVGNDIVGGAADKTPEEVARLFGYLADLLRSHQPEAPVICCDVRPAPSRFKAWDKIRLGNAALKAACEQREGVHYLDTSDAFLVEGGDAARADLYGPDRLHLNEAGYAVWSAQIKSEIDRVLGE